MCARPPENLVPGDRGACSLFGAVVSESNAFVIVFGERFSNKINWDGWGVWGRAGGRC